MSKPTNKPGWQNAGSEPTESLKTNGYSAGDKPSAANFNWLMKTVSDWVNYLETTTDTLNSAMSGSPLLSPVQVNFPNSGGANANEYNAGNTGASKTINWSQGSAQFATLNANCQLAFTNPVAGNTYYLRVQQDGAGGYLLNFPANITWEGNAVPVMTAGAYRLDVFGFYYDGSQYYGFKTQNYYNAPVTSETKNGYIAGGAANNTTVENTLEKTDLGTAEVFSIIQQNFGVMYQATGGAATYGNSGSVAVFGSGCQSSTAGYRTSQSYSGLLTGGPTHKVAFANDTAAPTAYFGTNGYWSSRYVTIQSTTAAYRHAGGSAVGKFNFDTDSFTNISSRILNGTTSGFAVVGSTVGTVWSTTTVSSNNSKFTYSTETNASASIYAPLTDSIDPSECVESSANAYHQRNTATASGGTVRLQKMNISTDQWAAISNSFTGAGSSASAIQGNGKGYFCGAQLQQSSSSGTSSVSTGSSVVRKIEYAPETYSVHSSSLQKARSLGAGFEG